jgi:lysophospholipase L1-like esterase
LAGCQLDAIIAKSHDFVSEANIVSFMGGINDLNNKTSLGSIEDNTVNTFYGRLNLLSKILIEKYSHSFIFYMTPFPSGKEKYNTRNFEGVCLEDYANAVKAVAHNYGIPVFDMYNESQFELEMYNADSDGVHPSEEFLERYTAPKIAEFIRQSYKV